MTCIVPGCARPRATLPGFCAEHARAPGPQRGGWLSAHQRKQGDGARAPLPLDANAVFHRLWMGSKPPVDRQMKSLDAVVLCAAEYQPLLPIYQGQVIRCPIDDVVPTPNELAMATSAAKKAAAIWRAGGRVLITCYAGRNRSGLVTGLVLLQVTRRDARQVIDMIRHARQNALTNRHFVAVLEGAGQISAAAKR